jgi:hypothetical protein
VQVVESVNNHCCITVDLDLIGGFAKFFRNGHLLGQAFTGVTAPISPALAFQQVRAAWKVPWYMSPCLSVVGKTEGSAVQSA